VLLDVPTAEVTELSERIRGDRYSLLRSVFRTHDPRPLDGTTAAIRQHALADTLVIGANTPDQKRLLDILAKEGMRAFLEARDGPFRS